MEIKNFLLLNLIMWIIVFCLSACNLYSIVFQSCENYNTAISEVGEMLNE